MHSRQLFAVACVSAGVVLGVVLGGASLLGSLGSLRDAHGSRGDPDSLGVPAP